MHEGMALMAMLSAPNYKFGHCIGLLESICVGAIAMMPLIQLENIVDYDGYVEFGPLP